MAGQEGGGLALLLILLLIRVFQRRRRRRNIDRLQLLTQRIKQRRVITLMLRRKRQKNRIRPVRKRKTMWVYPRPQFWFEHMLSSQHEDRLWQEQFRMTRQTFEHICALVGPNLARQDTMMRKCIPVRKRVAVALWRLATGDCYRCTGLTFGLGRSTAMTLRDEFCRELFSRAGEFIRFPQTEAETKRSINGFAALSDFPQVVGAIDGSHIPIKRPKKFEFPNDYYNRKSFHSIILQGIADADCRFIHVSTGYAGSIHDSRVLRMSSVPRKVQAGKILQTPVLRIGRQNVKPLLVADPAYKLTSWSMKPYPETAAITESQRAFNKSLSSARVVVEQAYGLLKGRWRCLLTKLDESVEKVPETITVCCILHNICSSVRDPTEINCPDVPHAEARPRRQDNNGEGTRLRDLIRRNYFQ